MRLCVASALLCATAFTGCAFPKAAGDANATASRETVTCSADPRVRVYHSGIVARGASGIYTFILRGANPVPPGHGANALTAQVQDARGQVVSGVTVTLKPWMPDHGHGPSSEPHVVAEGSTYKVTGLDLFMPGVWDLVFSATGPAGTDSATFTFCIDG